MPAVTIQLQVRKNQWGQKMYRAICLIQDHAVDGWGKTADEAHEALKKKLSQMVLDLYQQKKNENNQPSK